MSVDVCEVSLHLLEYLRGLSEYVGRSLVSGVRRFQLDLVYRISLSVIKFQVFSSVVELAINIVYLSFTVSSINLSSLACMVTAVLLPCFQLQR